MEEQAFKKVSYRDCLGKPHSHFVLEKRMPLPSALGSGLSEEVKQILDYQDYRIELDAEAIREEIERNSVLATLGSTDGEKEEFTKYTFEIPTEKVLESGDSASVDSPFGMTTEVYSENGLATSIGFRREMEDEHLFGEMEIFGDRIIFSGIFDGHGGIACAEHVKAHFSSYFNKWMEVFASFDKELRLVNALNLVFTEMSRTFEGSLAGTTANICLIIGDELFVANVGDSRAILVLPDKTLQLSEDQKPLMPQHKAFIEGRGAKISFQGTIIHYQSNYTIAPGRGIGDHHLKGGMYPRPIITHFTLPKKREECYLIQACDGVFDVASSEQVGDLIRERTKGGSNPTQIARDIAVTAYLSGSSDNISVYVKPLY